MMAMMMYLVAVCLPSAPGGPRQLSRSLEQSGPGQQLAAEGRARALHHETAACTNIVAAQWCVRAFRAPQVAVVLLLLMHGKAVPYERRRTCSEVPPMNSSSNSTSTQALCLWHDTTVPRRPNGTPCRHERETGAQH